MAKRIVVIGAGIAGLATAELLQRYPGNSVILVEATEQVGSGSSMDQHGWFHAGSLYSLRSNHLTMSSALSNLSVLIDHYANFFGAKPEDDGPPLPSTWFEARSIQYLFPGDHGALVESFLADPRGYKDRALRNFTEHAGAIATAEARMGRMLGFDRVLNGIKLVGADSPMRTPTIVRDLAESFLTNGGAIRFGAVCLGYERQAAGDIKVSLAGGESVTANELIFCTGGQSQGAHHMHTKASVRKSPVLVSSPKLWPDNLVVVEDENYPSLSHILHRFHGIEYSVISGGYSADAEDIEGQKRIAEELRQVVLRYFPTRAQDAKMQVFFGTKVDLEGDGNARDYSPQIAELDANVLSIFPGKFSFSFLLAKDVARRIMNCSAVPEAPAVRSSIDARRVARPRHELIAGELIDQELHRHLQADFLAKLVCPKPLVT
ncbi:FAD-dependent oxidoreductase [Variovorax sp. J22R133]|uniref:FAD-dependent oxidoreductase n=1 Tax=Variovorax brevis TaxID=3053503 RepID=UPI002578E512|nr:FAD-dependent oxidoreductase [Variovorax sp. J22R133]MDM0112706.1 FAD-dependent oxidoreductase [Variovorax sp. J22R133]